MTHAGRVVVPLCIALGAVQSLCAAELELSVEGVDGDLRGAILSRLTLAQYEDRDVAPATIRYQFDNAEQEIREALEPFGYYAPDIDARLEEDGDAVHATFEVDAGEPVVVRSLNVTVASEAAELPAVAAAIESFEPDVGDRLDHGAYESSKSAIGSALRSAGYLDASLEQHRVAVSIENRAADIDVVWEPGPRYEFGEVRFSDVQFPREFLVGYVPWEEGESYSTTKLLELQQRLTTTDYFQTVSVQPNLEERADGVIPVDVLLTENERNFYSAGLYYSTDFGAGVRLEYERRWLNDKGHTLATEIEYSQRLQEYGLTYRIPRPGPQDRDFTFGFAYADEESDTARSRSARIAAAESRRRWRGFTRTLGLQYLRGDFEIGDDQRQSAVFYAEGTLSRRRLDDLTRPRNGYVADLGVRLAPSAFLSDTWLAQIWLGGGYLRSVGRNSRLITRLDLGAMAVDDFDDLPPELRFFAGGDRSLRGFDYQAIGERDADGDVIGGEYLVTTSVEYEHFFDDNWGAAMFVDAGDAFTNDFEVNVSVGIGARWRSPVGVVRLDFAKPVVTDFEDGWRLHLTIGPTL
ncbi:MAG TPA: autotransporter assembly complex family protein [Steroidobacteraceae bacterium]|nr:autotransporter assembly complex family protein [Steroidobacteraceae bacterium]